MPPNAALATKPSLTLKRRLNATPERVYTAWTDPEQVAQWFGPPHTETVEAEADAREGGRYRIFMRSKDGEEHDVRGIYRKVVPNRELVFTWAWQSTPEREFARYDPNQTGRRWEPLQADPRALLRRDRER